MTTLEVVADIRARNKERKLYGSGKGQISQPMFSRYLALIEREMCKPATVSKFFGRFGYTGSFNEWNKTDA